MRKIFFITSIFFLFIAMFLHGEKIIHLDSTGKEKVRTFAKPLSLEEQRRLLIKGLILREPEKSALSIESPEEYKKLNILQEEPELIIKKIDFMVDPEELDVSKIISEEKRKKDIDELEHENSTQNQNKKLEKDKLRKQLVAIAEKWFNEKKRFYQIGNIKIEIYNDCSSYVRSIYHAVTGIDIYWEASTQGIMKTLKLPTDSGCAYLYGYFKTQHHYDKIPKIGDTVIFDNTYDRNRNKRSDDLLTHAGIVIDMDKEGTVTFLHANVGNPSTIKKAYLNIKYPHEAIKNGKLINSYLRKKYAWDGPNAKVLAGQLLNGFGGF